MFNIFIFIFLEIICLEKIRYAMYVRQKYLMLFFILENT